MIIPFGGSSYNIQLDTIIKDKGWKSVSLIKCDNEPDGVDNAKDAFLKTIQDVEQIKLPVAIIDYILKPQSNNFKKNRYLQEYKSFYQSSYFDKWTNICQKYKERKKVYEEYKEVDIKLASELYVTPQSATYKRKLYDLQEELNSIDKDLNQMQEEANAIYQAFTDNLDKI